MSSWLQIVLAVLAPSGIIATLIEKTRRENNKDHARNSTLLQQIDTKVDKIDDRLDGHIEWHLDREK